VITAAEVLRLARIADRVRTLNAETTAERARRNGLIRELIERGEKYRAVSRAASLSIGAIAAVMAGSDAG
jgi:hypothetical protein